MPKIADNTRGTVRSDDGESTITRAAPARRSSRVLRRSCTRALEKFMPGKPMINAKLIGAMVLNGNGKEAALTHHETIFDAHTGGELADLEARCAAMAALAADSTRKCIFYRLREMRDGPLFEVKDGRFRSPGEESIRGAIEIHPGADRELVRDFILFRPEGA